MDDEMLREIEDAAADMLPAARDAVLPAVGRVRGLRRELQAEEANLRLLLNRERVRREAERKALRERK